MNTKTTARLCALVLLLCSVAVIAAGRIGIIVNKNLYPFIKPSIDMYIDDIKKIEGKDAWLNATTFDESGNKKDLRDSLRYHYTNNDLEGAVFVGDLPLSDFLSDGTLRDIFPCDLYYMDLNGTWTPEDLPDTHSGSKSAEIWISRIVSSVLTYYADMTETEIVQRYFDRVHLRMYGQDNQPSTYLLAGMYGEWSSLENENKGYLGYNSGDMDIFRTYSDATDSVFTERWGNSLIAGKEYAYIYSHAGGLPYRHKVGYYIYDIYEDPTNCRFYNIYCCQNARYTTKNMCGAYATDDQGLVSMGAAKSGSMRPGSYRAYNEPLGNGVNFGESFRRWYNSEGLSSISWHYGMTMQGVGTLRLQPYNPPNDNTAPTGLALTGNSVDENAGANAFVGTFSTTDPDNGQSHTYSLVWGVGDSGNADFSISGDTLYAKSSLDYETQSSFSICVRTKDNGTGNFWYDKSFTITVNNINETPTAVALSSESIVENAGANADVGTLSSTDPDNGQTHAYTLASGTGDDDNSSFSLSGSTLQAKASFDFETKSSYSIRIRTTDNGSGNLWYEAVFTITVSNANETPTVLALSGEDVDENAGANADVGTLSTTDPDTGQVHTYTLVTGTGSSDNASFTISGGILQAVSSFDYEIKNSYSIRIRTTDNMDPVQSIEQAFTITVNNVNEAPTLLAFSGQGVDENSGADVDAGTFSSTDPDTGQAHTYTLVSGTGDDDNSSFTVNGNDLLTKESFDFETKSSYSIRVRTTDDGTPDQYLEETFSISVTDINETPTALALSVHKINENAGVDADVGDFATTDPDTGQSYTYTLVSGTGSTDNTSFTVNGNTLKAKLSFNYENKSSYKIRVRTTDNGTPEEKYEKAFTISVTNINEAPKALSLSEQEIDENAGSDAEIGVLSTTDPDNGQDYTYTLVEGTGDKDNDDFNIGGDALRAKSSFNFERKDSYTVRIRTTDNGSGNLSFEKSFSVTVVNVNESPEDIAVDNLIVNEKVSGADIGNVSVSDPDNGDEHTFEVDDSRFEIVSGMLKLKEDVQLKHSAEPDVELRITASDAGGLSLTEEFTVTVKRKGITNSITIPFIALPNPVIRKKGNQVIFHFTNDDIVDAEMKIFDAVGNLVYDFSIEDEDDGKFYWDLQNKQGRIVGSGTYIALLKVTDTRGFSIVLKTSVGVKERIK